MEFKVFKVKDSYIINIRMRYVDYIMPMKLKDIDSYLSLPDFDKADESTIRYKEALKKARIKLIIYKALDEME